VQHISLINKLNSGGIEAMNDDRKVIKPKVQNLILENREKLSVSGVTDVISFNEDTVVVDTELGVLIVRGENLHINKLSIDSLELSIEGEIYSCEYSEKDASRTKGSFLAKMFK